MISFHKAVHLFFKGLERNFKMIRFGDVPVYHIRKEAEEKYKRLSTSRMPRVIAAIYLFREFFLSRHKNYIGSVPKTLYCGSTRNNEREFLFLQDLMCNSEVASFFEYKKEKNISFYSTQKGKYDLYHIFVRLVFYFCCLVYLCRIKVNPTSLRFLVRFATAYYRLFVYFDSTKEYPRISIFANDHTDISVALSMIMKLHGIPRIYVQHAEVTQDFPGLDFEYAVLRNKQSLKVYASIAKIGGSTYVIPREKKDASFEEITHVSPDKVDVVIYLSSTFIQKKVEEAVSYCQLNPGISSVAIKKHPRSQDRGFSFLDGVPVYDVIPEYDHIALVPNSSVVIDLLHRGIKAYQLFELDHIREDYYGFVREMVTPKIYIEELKTGFWKRDFYNESWLERFEAYDPSVSDHWKKDFTKLNNDVAKQLTISKSPC